MSQLSHNGNMPTQSTIKRPPDSPRGIDGARNIGLRRIHAAAHRQKDCATHETVRDALIDCASTRAYSSPYLRARQTIEPIAQARGLTIETVEDLRERLLSPADLPDWRAHLKRSWEDFDYAPAGGETSREAQARVRARPRDDRVATPGWHRDPREPRQFDRARAQCVHAKRRLRILGIDPDAGSVHADSRWKWLAICR